MVRARTKPWLLDYGRSGSIENLVGLMRGLRGALHRQRSFSVLFLHRQRSFSVLFLHRQRSFSVLLLHRQRSFSILFLHKRCSLGEVCASCPAGKLERSGKAASLVVRLICLVAGSALAKK